MMEIVNQYIQVEMVEKAQFSYKESNRDDEHGNAPRVRSQGHGINTVNVEVKQMPPKKVNFYQKRFAQKLDIICPFHEKAGNKLADCVDRKSVV